VGVLFAPGSWCPGCTPDQEMHPLVCAKSRAQTRDPSPPSCSANLRRSRITKRQQGFTFVHPLGLSLAGGFPLGVVRSWAFPSLLHTPPLPATHGEVGTGIGHLPERSLSSAPLMRSDRVSHRYFPFRQWAPFDTSMAEIRQLACILQYIYILMTMKLCSRWPAISPPGMIGDGDDWHGR